MFMFVFERELRTQFLGGCFVCGAQGIPAYCRHNPLPSVPANKSYSPPNETACDTANFRMVKSFTINESIDYLISACAQRCEVLDEDRGVGTLSTTAPITSTRPRLRINHYMDLVLWKQLCVPERPQILFTLSGGHSRRLACLHAPYVAPV
uniref:Uncharacterized protein n=1 Tax=Timema poppense TaxID=170557 RepID=A0A7R9DKH9_TIMPO|nr:unnamed protein product [Timema poppensis]